MHRAHFRFRSVGLVTSLRGSHVMLQRRRVRTFCPVAQDHFRNGTCLRWLKQHINLRGSRLLVGRCGSWDWIKEAGLGEWVFGYVGFRGADFKMRG